MTAAPSRAPARLTTIAVVAAIVAALAFMAYHAISGARRSAFVDRSREQTALLLAMAWRDGVAPTPADIVDGARETGRVDVVVVSRGRESTSDPRLAVAAVPASVRLAPPDELPAADARGDLPFVVVGGRTDAGVTVYAFYPDSELEAGIAALRPALGLAWLLSVLLVMAGMHAGARRRTRRLAARNERERRFNADMAHELRTPLAAMVTAASLLDDTDDLPRHLRAPVLMVVAQTRRLKALVDDLLELARLEAGGHELRPELLSPAALAAAVVRAGGWHDAVDLVAGDAPAVRTDRRALARILFNLIANAVHHGAGRARVRISRDAGTARVDVVDDGPGIPVERIDRIFRRTTRRDGGSGGLGLAIARENAELLGAELSVRSLVGVGTRFTVRVPAAGDGTPGTPDDHRLPAASA